MKFIKISLSIIVGLLLLVIVAAAIFLATFDVNELKPQISEQVKQQTGRDFQLGDIKKSMFPWLGIELQQLSLSNARGFKARQMLEVERIDVRMALLPLFRGEVRVDTLRLHGLKLALAKDKQGKTNWDDILQKQQAASKQAASKQAEKTTTQKDKPETEQDTESSTALAALMVNGIEIKDADIRWYDASTKQTVLLQQFNLNTGAIKLGQPLPLKLSSQVIVPEQQGKFDIALQSTINFDPQSQALQLETLSLTVDALLKQMGVDQAQIKLDTQLDANLQQQVFKLSAINLNINAKGKAIPSGEIKANLKTAADIDLTKQTAHIKQLSINTLGLNILSDVKASKLLDSPQAKGQFKLNQFNPAKLMKTLAIDLPEMQGKKILNNAALSFDFTASEKSASLKKLLIEFDQSKIRGSAKLAQFNKPQIEYQLSLDKIKLDDYLPPKPPEAAAKEKSSKTTSAKASTDTPIELPVEMLRSLNIKGVFKAQEIIAFEQKINRLHIETLAGGGLVKLPKIHAQLLDGGISSSAQLDVRKNTPLYQMTLNGKGLEADSVASPIIQDMLGEKDVRLTGASNLDLNINSRGQSVKQLMANSNGQFKFNMGKAELHEADIEFYVRQAVTSYMDEKNIPVKDSWRGEYKPKQTTALKVVRASAIIKNGLVENKDLLMDATRFKVTGAGSINLPREKINYRAVLDVKPANLKTTADKIMDVPMPVKVKGSFSKPVIDIQRSAWAKGIGKVMKTEAKKAYKKKAKKEVNKAKDKLKEKFKGWLK